MSTFLPLPKDVMKFPVEGGGGAFGYQRSSSHVHQGIDLHAPIGTPVFSVQEGEIVSARNTLNPAGGKTTGAGRNLVVKHPSGFFSWYMHLSKLLVGPGDKVKAGQQIAESGDSMFSDKSARIPHLHFEILTAYPPGKEPAGGGIVNRVNPTPWLQERNASGAFPGAKGGGFWGWLLLGALAWRYTR